MLLSIHIIITLNSISNKLFSSISFSSSSGELSLSLFYLYLYLSLSFLFFSRKLWNYFFVFPFWLLLCICVCVCVLQRSAKILVGLCQMLPMTGFPQPVGSCLWSTAYGPLCTGPVGSSANVLELQGSAFAWMLSVRVCLWDSLQVYALAARLKLHRMEWEWFLWAGLLLPFWLMLLIHVCSAWERWLLQYG